MANAATCERDEIVQLRRKLNERDGEIAQLRKQLDERDNGLAELCAQNASLSTRIAELERLVEEVRRSGKRQAAPFRKGDPKEAPAKPGRKKGNAHGRHGHRMAPTHVDREIDVGLPGSCPHCGGEIVEGDVFDQYQSELPEMRPVVTRFRVHVGRCRGCKKRIQPRHPEQTSDALGAAGSQLGPNAKAWAAWLHYGLGLSFGKVTDVLGRLGVPVTRGALPQSATSTCTDLVPTNKAIRKHVGSSDMVVMDESGWRIGGKNAWLWVAVSRDATLYYVDYGRGFSEAVKLVDEDYDGVIVRDGWGVYSSYTKATHQTCIAHLLRRCREMKEELPDWALGTPKRVADILTDALDARDLSGSEREAAFDDVTERMDMVLEGPTAHKANKRLIKHLRHEQDALFTFLRIPDIDATNWRGEQAVRPAVVNRKVWGGNRTEHGATVQGSIMTFLRTATQQGVDAIEAIVTLARDPTPGIAPGLRLVQPHST